MRAKMLVFLLLMALPALACGESTPVGEAPAPAPIQTASPTYTPEPTATLVPAPPTGTPTDTPEPATIPSPEPPAREVAQVLRVIDGDTIEVDIGGTAYTLRYIGIDCPETKHPEKPVEWMGAEAAAANEALVGGQEVELEKDVSETDQYGRLLRYVWLGNLMVNAELVRLGYAQASSYPPDVKHQDLFVEMQQEAREAERGLWQPRPTSPPTVAATPIPSTATMVATPSPPAPAATEIPPPTVTPAPTQPPSAPPPQPVCECSGNLYNCSDFGTHADAQKCYDYCVSVGRGDIHKLDRDNDGIACESLP